MPSTGTDVTYAGIEMHNVTTRQWDQTIVYDESGTDPIGIRYNLTFEGILHVQSISDSAVTVPAWIGDIDGRQLGNDAPDSLNKLHEMLSRPRQTLIVRMNGKQALNVIPADGNASTLYKDYDVDNGPKPQQVRVTHIVRDKVFRVQFTIVAMVLGCVSGTTVNNTPVLNNRWSVGEEMDDDFFTTRTISGTVRFSISDPAMLPTGHYYKYIIVPPLENGFRRARLHYLVTPDGLSAKYTIVDRQVHTAAPWPATRISGRHTESTQYGETFIGECQVRLEGAPNSDKRLLIQRAVQVIESRMPLLKEPFDRGDDALPSYVPQHISMTDHFGERNAVEMTVRIQQNPGQGDKKTARVGNLVKDTFGSPIRNLPAVDSEPEPYNQSVSTKPATYGYWIGGIRHPIEAFLNQCYLQTQCSDKHGITGTGISATPPDSDTGDSDSTSITSSTTDAIEDSPGDLYADSSESDPKFYDYARMESSYFYNSLRVQMPIARTPDPSTEDTRDTSVVFTLGGRQCRREIRVDVESVGAWPEIPQPKDEYTDGTLKGTRLKFWHRLHVPILTVDGRSKLYRITAYYLYAMNRAPLDSEKLNVGVLPYTSLKLEDEQYDPSESYSEALGP